MARNIHKQLVIAQDIKHGVGKITQQRGQTLVTVDKVDIPLGLSTAEEVAAVDKDAYPRVRVGSVEFQANSTGFQQALDVKPLVYAAGVEVNSANPYVYYGQGIFKRLDLPYVLVSPEVDGLAVFDETKWSKHLASDTSGVVQEVAPANPFPGLRWYKPSSATTYIYDCSNSACAWMEEPVQSAEGTLRSELAETDSDVLVGGVPARRVSDSPVNGIDFNVVLDNSTDNTTAFNTLSTSEKRVILPAGVAQAAGVAPTNSWGIKGSGRSITALKNSAADSNILDMSGQFDTQFEHLTFSGLGAGSGTTENGVVFDGTLNGRRNTFSYVDFANFSGSGAKFSAGWGNSLHKSRAVSSSIGLEFVVSPLLAGWSGSGFVLDQSYIASCNTGIEMEAIWNFTAINVVIEDCDLPINQTAGASPAVWINPWFESNRQSPALSYSNIFIGGRLEGGEVPAAGFYDNMTLPAAPFDYECITELLYGVRVFRDPDDEIFAADGQGIKAFKAHSSLGWAPEDIAGSSAKRISVGYGSGALGGGVTSTVWGGTQNTWDDITTLTGRRHFNSFDTPNMPYLGVKVQGYVTNSLGGIGYARVAISTGEYYTGGGGGSQSAERWQFDALGHLSPFADGSYDIGISGARVRDIRVVNAPIVGSDERLKKDIQSIPQALLDFAMSVEIKQYKLKNGTSGRNHYGVIITPEFLTALGEVQSVVECGAFCQDVFTDMEGNPITVNVGGTESGDIWQVRYDEWQNIILEALRRKVNDIPRL